MVRTQATLAHPLADVCDSRLQVKWQRFYRTRGNPAQYRKFASLESLPVSSHSQNELQSVRSSDGIARDVAEFLATLPAPRGRLQEVQKNMPTRIAAMQPHCSSVIRSRSTSAAKASVTSG